MIVINFEFIKIIFQPDAGKNEPNQEKNMKSILYESDIFKSFTIHSKYISAFVIDKF